MPMFIASQRAALPAPGVLSWFDASRLQGSDGDKFTIAADISGNGAYGIANASDRRITLRTAVQNGLNIGEWADTAPTLINYTNLYRGKREASMYAMLRSHEDPGVNLQSYGFGKTGTGSADHYPFTDGNCYMGFCSTVRKSIGNLSQDLEQYHILSMHSRAGLWEMYVNNVQVHTTTTNVFAVQSDFRIGISANGEMWHGYIGEMIFKDTYDLGSERERITNNLATKWAITI